MLRKLFKHEFKATGRTFIPLYIAIIVVSLLNGLFLNPNNRINNIQGIGIVVLVGLFVALGVLTLVVTIQRFSKNLLGDEGYLMFTLPVSTKMLILSKTIVSTIWCFFSGLTAMISFFIIGMSMIIKTGSLNKMQFDLFFKELGIVLSSGEIWLPILQLVEVGVLGLLCYAVFILLIYLAISIAQLPLFSRHRKVTGFISFFILNIIINYILSLIGELFTETSRISFQPMIIISYISVIALGAVLFFATNYILEKKLNLE